MTNAHLAPRGIRLVLGPPDWPFEDEEPAGPTPAQISAMAAYIRSQCPLRLDGIPFSFAADSPPAIAAQWRSDAMLAASIARPGNLVMVTGI